MNTNKKDVNDYFKYLRIYYRELALKRKKELEEKKKKQQEIDRIRKKHEIEFINLKKEQELNIKKKRKKVKKVVKLKLKKKNINPTKKVDIAKKPEELKKPIKVAVNTLNKETKNIKKEEAKKDVKKETKKEIKPEVKHDVKKEVVKKEENPKEIKKETTKKEVKPIKEEVKKENVKKKEPDKKEVKVTPKVAVIEPKKEAPTIKNTETKKEVKKETKKENNNSKKKVVVSKKLKVKDNKKQETKDTKNIDNKKKVANVNEVKKESILEAKKLEEKKLEEKKIEEKKAEEKKIEEKKPKVVAVNSKEKVAPKKKEVNEKSEEEKDKEENLKLGKKEFIDTLNKALKDDKDQLRELDLENYRIRKELDNTKDLNDINKLLARLKKNQDIENTILSRINKIKDGSIILDVYDLSKKQPKYLKDYIEMLKTDKNDIYFKELYENFKYDLNHKDTITHIINETNAVKKEIESKQTLVNDKGEKIDYDNNLLENYKNKKLKLESAILKFQISLNDLENKVKNISATEKLEKRYFLGNKEIKNKLELNAIALKLFHSKDNNLSHLEIYNKLKNSLRTELTSRIVSNATYKDVLLKEKENLFKTKKDLVSTLDDVRKLKQDFIFEFKDYLSTSEYYNFISDIELLEDKLSSQKQKISILDKKVDITMLEHDKKVTEIEKMNETKDKNNNLNNNQNKNNNQNINNTQHNKQQMPYQNNPNIIEYPFYDYYEPEEKTRGRSR